jgi:hypothetical protein
MPIKTLRSTLALALAGGLFATAPAAAAQTLVPLVGEPIPYQLSVPDGWEMEREDDEMLYVMGEEMMLLVAVSDLMAEEENPLPVSEAEARRIFTNMMLESDSLLLGLLDQGFTQGMGGQIMDPTREIRELGGERAGYLRGRIVADGEPGWVDVHLTMKDGIMYMLAFVVQGADIERFAPLMARIRESFVLAPAPAP